MKRKWPKKLIIATTHVLGPWIHDILTPYRKFGSQETKNCVYAKSDHLTEFKVSQCVLVRVEIDPN
jgi:hypothetical protein